MLRKGYKKSVIRYHNGKISEFKLPQEELLRIVTKGQVYQTSGCDDCNRPYYNDHPGRPLYNYHRPLTPAELTAALGESDLAQLSCEAGAAAVSSAPGSGTTVLSVSEIAAITAAREKEVPHA